MASDEHGAGGEAANDSPSSPSALSSNRGENPSREQNHSSPGAAFAKKLLWIRRKSENLHQNFVKPTCDQHLLGLPDAMTPKEFSQYNCLLAYSICSLFFVQLKLSGQNAEKHPILLELARIQSYMKRVITIPDLPTKTSVVNSQAALRMVRHNVDRKSRLGPKKRRRIEEAE